MDNEIGYVPAAYPGREKTTSRHFDELLSQHDDMLSQGDVLLSQLGLKAYNLGDIQVESGEKEASDTLGVHGYPNQYLYLLDKQRAQLDRLEKIINFMNTVI